MEEYVADAKTFKPERWLKESADERLHPFASLPYGYGARMCLGRRFADLEMQVLLTKVQSIFKLDGNRFKQLNNHFLKFASANSLVQIGVSSRAVEVQSYLHVRTWRWTEVQDNEEIIITGRRNGNVYWKNWGDDEARILLYKTNDCVREHAVSSINNIFCI